MLAQNLDQIQSASGVKLSFVNVAGLIENILPYFFYGAGILLLVYLILGGLQMMLSQGDPKAMQAAQAKITNALIGFVIVIFSYVIVVIVGRIFGITSFQLIFGGSGPIRGGL